MRASYVSLNEFSFKKSHLRFSSLTSMEEHYENSMGLYDQIYL